MGKRVLIILVAALALARWSVSIASANANERNATTAAPAEEGVSAQAFSSFVIVLRHPRCMNCHSSGDFPRQGDDMHPHTMDVRRGPAGHGVTAQTCGTCHQSQNLQGMDMPPGAPNWHLPAPDMPMIWEGLTDGQICAQLKDPQQNRHRSIQQIVQHMTSDKLVMWAWDPGDGRLPVPMSHDEFSGKVKQWADNGAACPR